MAAKATIESSCLFNNNITLTFNYLADAFIHSELQHSADIHFHGYLSSLGTQPLTLVLLALCSSSRATGQ